MPMNGATAEPGTVGELLKRCRQRLSSNIRSLGVCVRVPVRIGKVVTQEEVAEAAGISRVWYATMENDRAPRVSVRVLGQITVLS
jgi:transcriptional regulator with XRE-family HTH domain